MKNILDIKKDFLAKLEKASSLNDITDLKVEFLGRKSEIINLSKTIASLSLEEKKTIGSSINELKEFISTTISSKEETMEQEKILAELKKEAIDITIPCKREEVGLMHPMARVQRELEQIFISMGFSITEGPEIEDDWHCFEGLNFPPNHPARQMQDTFFLPNYEGSKIVLRTQTTALQTRQMTSGSPPFKFITLGKTFRSEMDTTHAPMFHQIDAVYLNKNVTVQDLRDCLVTFCKKFFELQDVPLRIRPSYFPFTSPSLEIDVKCTKEDGKLVLGKGNDWIEVCGGGMIHPTVLKNCNINSNEWQGFAFGFGIERVAMLKYGIRDIRNMYEGDLRFLKKYGFKIFD